MDEERQGLAEEFFYLAFREHAAGRLEEAARLYRSSIEAFPTAEAHTHLGWLYSQGGRLDEAIAECLIAVGLDPAYGNPLNDIGAYLIDQGKPWEALGWLERACVAPRYDQRAFPHLNLARLWAEAGVWWKERAELEAALALSPDDASARRRLAGLAAKLN
jgi:Tfp pilus assembly protein PilF